MMFAANLLKPVIHDAEEVVVGFDDPAVGFELDHRLNFVDRGQHSLIHSDRRHVEPFQDIADIVAAGIEAAIDRQGDFKVANGNFRPYWELGRIGQHLALMRGVFVEHIDAAADDLFRIEIWPNRLECRCVLPQKLARRIIDIGDDKIAIDHHDGGRNPVDDVALECIDVVRTRCIPRS
jgi:hypothetical protein